MSDPSSDPARASLLETIRTQIRRLESAVSDLAGRNQNLILTSLVCGGLSTLVAGLTAAKGTPLVAMPQAWRWTCLLAALLTFGTTLAAGLQKAFSVPEKLGSATACLGRLRALELALAVRGASPEEVAREYEALLTAHGELLH
jgi:hypothetical protein